MRYEIRPGKPDCWGNIGCWFVFKDGEDAATFRSKLEAERWVWSQQLTDPNLNFEERLIEEAKICLKTALSILETSDGDDVALMEIEKARDLIESVMACNDPQTNDPKLIR